jgi:hypothetical protein
VTVAADDDCDDKDGDAKVRCIRHNFLNNLMITESVDGDLNLKRGCYEAAIRMQYVAMRKFKNRRWLECLSEAQ